MRLGDGQPRLASGGLSDGPAAKGALWQPDSRTRQHRYRLPTMCICTDQFVTGFMAIRQRLRSPAVQITVVPSASLPAEDRRPISGLLPVFWGTISEPGLSGAPPGSGVSLCPQVGRGRRHRSKNTTDTLSTAGRWRSSGIERLGGAVTGQSWILPRDYGIDRHGFSLF